MSNCCTLPAVESTIASRTVPCIPATRASGGYSGCTLCFSWEVATLPPVLTRLTRGGGPSWLAGRSVPGDAGVWADGLVPDNNDQAETKAQITIHLRVARQSSASATANPTPIAQSGRQSARRIKRRWRNAARWLEIARSAGRRTRVRLRP
jgi:hypothetical protein